MVGQDTLRTLSQLKRPKCFSKKRQFHNINFYNIENLFSNRAHPSISIAFEFVPENQHNFCHFLSFSEKS